MFYISVAAYRTPNPVNDRGVNWRPFEEFSRNYIDFSLHLDACAAQQQPWPRSVVFWNDYVPHLMAGQRSGSQLCRGQGQYKVIPIVKVLGLGIIVYVNIKSTAITLIQV